MTRYHEITFDRLPTGVAFTLAGPSGFDRMWRRMRFVKTDDPSSTEYGGWGTNAAWLHDGASYIAAIDRAQPGSACFISTDALVWVRL